MNRREFTNGLDFNKYTDKLEQAGIDYDCGVTALGIYWVEY